MELLGLLNTLFGVNLVIACMILALILCLKKHEYWLGFLSNILAASYCFCAAQGILSPDYLPVLLLASVAAALFSIPLIWKDMLFNIVDHAYQWTFLLIVVGVLTINQLLLNQIVLFLGASILVSAIILFRSIHQHGALIRRLNIVSNELERASFKVGFDLSTGLPNKNGFEERIDKWIYVNPKVKVNIVAFKLTRFAELNRLIGHNNADLVKLQLVSRIRKKLERVAEIILLNDDNGEAYFASAGGVDFVLAIREDLNNYATENIISLLDGSVNEPIVVDSTAVDVGIEFGVSSYPEQGNAVSSLIENAFLAMNQAHETNTSIYFDTSQHTKLLNKKTIIVQLKEDFDLGRFSVYVQPQVNIKTKEIIGGELLVRWNREGEGIVSAKEFISLAEQSGIIYQLNMWTIEKAIQTLASMKADGLKQTLSVNVSNRELLQSHMVESILSLLDEYMVPPEQLIIEIKESAFAENKSKALKVARLLQQSGINVAIDDFGKDFTAIETFNHFNPYYLKIDCRHISNSNKGSQLNTYTNAIIGVAKSLKIPVVAQGIESAETEQQLMDLECEMGQGFFYSKPFDLVGFSIWLEQWRRSQQRLD